MNPGQLAKGSGGGTYAELAVHPMPRDMLTKKQEGERLERLFHHHCIVASYLV